MKFHSSLIAIALTIFPALSMAAEATAEAKAAAEVKVDAQAKAIAAQVTPVKVTLKNAVLTEHKNGNPAGITWKAGTVKVKPIPDLADPSYYKVAILSVSGCNFPGYSCPVAGQIAYITSTEYDQSFDSSTNIVTGMLVVPFKYHFSDHATTAGSTIGGYVGYGKTETFGSLACILAGGLALVNPTPASAGSNQTNTSASTSTLTGVTLATGVIGAIGKTNVQFGVLVGTDLVEKSQNYKYDGKPWLSFTVGYAFSN